MRRNWKAGLREAVGRVASDSPLVRRLEHALYRVNSEPIIVLGNQKSGTSAIAHLLADSCDLSKSVDIPELWPPAIVRILKGQDSLAALAGRHPRPFSRDLIKEPHLTFVVPQVTELWPRARFVFVVRDPRANIRSILNRLRIPGDLTDFEVDDSAIPEAWKAIFDPRIWGTDSHHYIGVLADRWRLAALAYLQQREKMVLVRYEDFIAAKVQVIDSIAGEVGLAAVRDISGSVDVQYQPQGDHSVSLERFFGDAHLRMIDEICHEEMRLFDYRRV
jgi:hypothetical protein